MTTPNQVSSWPFEFNHTENWAYWDGMFTPAECKTIVDIGKRLTPTDGVVMGTPSDGTALNPAIRKSNVAWIFPSNETAWMFERMTHVIKDLNGKYFKFDLSGMVEGFQFTEYNAPSGFYGPHLDTHIGAVTRKLSVSVQLSHDADYEGGELMLHYSNTPLKAPTAQGKAIVFPSYTLHEVTPVTKGTRYSLVCWITGSPFK